MLGGGQETITEFFCNGRVAQINATTDYFLTDALGSVRQMVNTSDAITLAKSYDPYGAVRSNAQLIDSPYGYTGEFTESTGIVYLRARHYDPNQGRFMSRDTWTGDANNPMSFNRWNYTTSNPVNFIDPSGHNQCDAIPDGPARNLCNNSDYGEQQRQIDLQKANDPCAGWDTRGIQYAICDHGRDNPTIDYYDATLGLSAGTNGIIPLEITVDRKNRWYYTIGCTKGISWEVSGSLSTGAFLGPQQISSNDLENAIMGDSAASCAGAGPGGGVIWQVPHDKFDIKNVSVEAGVYTPQAGIAITTTFKFYDPQKGGFMWENPDTDKIRVNIIKCLILYLTGK